ncbi:MAG: hypothetical protein QCH35_09985 [Methanomicrobiaceae archaeon]|nr:hypothetical protein [Methanomicrobiaceae archaeon]
MAEYDLDDDAMVGSLARSRVQEFEQEHPGWSVYVGDSRGMWDVRFTRTAGEERVGRAYITLPEAPHRIWRIHWPAGDMEVLESDQTGGLEGFVLEALRREAEA